MTTKGTRVGFIGGMETPPVVRFLSGFEAGLRYVNPDIKVSVAYVGSFTEPAKAKELALGIYDLGADLIMDVAGGGGRGIFDAAKGLGTGYWVIGVDTCKGQFAPGQLPDLGGQGRCRRSRVREYGRGRRHLHGRCRQPRAGQGRRRPVPGQYRYAVARDHGQGTRPQRMRSSTVRSSCLPPRPS